MQNGMVCSEDVSTVAQVDGQNRDPNWEHDHAQNGCQSRHSSLAFQEQHGAKPRKNEAKASDKALYRTQTQQTSFTSIGDHKRGCCQSTCVHVKCLVDGYRKESRKEA